MNDEFEYVDATEVRADRTRSIGEILPGVLADLRRRVRREEQELELAAWWEGIVGPVVSAATRVVGWQGGTLTIGVETPSQMQEYQMLLGKVWKRKMAARKPPLPVDNVHFRLLDCRAQT